VRSVRADASGPGIYTYRLIRALARRLQGESDFDFLLFHNGRAVGLDGLGPNFVPVRLWHAPGRRISELLFEQVLLPAALARARVDVFHSPVFFAPLVQSCPQVITVHDMYYFRYADRLTLQRRLIYNSILTYNIRHAFCVITVSEFSKRDIAAMTGVSESKIQVIYNCVEPCYQPRPKAAAQQATSKRLNIPAEQRLLLCPAGLSWRKNIPRLLAAFAILKHRHGLPHKLILTGKLEHSGNLEDNRQLKELATSQGIGNEVIFTGHVDENTLIDLYNAAELVIYPSLFEGFGLPVIEAMACGVPVVASNCSSVPEIGGDAYLAFDPNSIDDMVEKVLRGLGDAELRARLVERGLRRAAKFSWRAMADRILEVYRRAVAQRAPAAT